MLPASRMRSKDPEREAFEGTMIKDPTCVMPIASGHALSAGSLPDPATSSKKMAPGRPSVRVPRAKTMTAARHHNSTRAGDLPADLLSSVEFLSHGHDGLAGDRGVGTSCRREKLLHCRSTRG